LGRNKRKAKSGCKEENSEKKKRKILLKKMIKGDIISEKNENRLLINLLYIVPDFVAMTVIAIYYPKIIFFEKVQE